jgi:hypothetical protein
MFYGPSGGYGYMTYGGIPGVFDLLPYGPGTYYGFVPIPVGYVYPNPPIVCHFWPRHRKPIVVRLQRPPHVVHLRDPAPRARRVAIERELHLAPPMVPSQMRSILPAAPRVFFVPRSIAAPRPGGVVPAPPMRAPRPVIREVRPRPAPASRHAS